MKLRERAKIKFRLNPAEELELQTLPDVFMPNATTNLLIQAVKNKITVPVDVLDLGCGTGVVGIALYLKKLTNEPVYASDLSASAVTCSRENFENYGCKAQVLRGSLFGPWIGKKFDVIIDDISGIAQGVAEVSPWFQGVPCDTGVDGVDLVAEIIRNAPQYLNEAGHFFFPLLSLSNVDKILQVAKQTFSSVELVGRQDWPLPAELKTYMPLLRKLSESGSIKLEEKFGMVLCYTEVYCATNPIL